jgi:hypothetical protein
MNPDKEIIAAARPALATLGNVSMLVAISSPYGRKGEAWESYRRYADGHDPEVLVVNAPSIVMTPSLNPNFLQRDKERDLIAYQREFEAEFSNDIAAFVDPETIESLCLRPHADRVSNLGRPIPVCSSSCGGQAPTAERTMTRQMPST